MFGLTDVWSVIRNAVASRLGGIIDRLSLAQLHDFFLQLVTVVDVTDMHIKNGPYYFSSIKNELTPVQS